MRAFLDLAGMVGCRHAPGPARSRHAPAPPPTRDAHRPEPDRPGGPLDRSLAFIFRSFSFPRKREAAQHYSCTRRGGPLLYLFIHQEEEIENHNVATCLDWCGVCVSSDICDRSVTCVTHNRQAYRFIQLYRVYESRPRTHETGGIIFRDSATCLMHQQTRSSTRSRATLPPRAPAPATAVRPPRQ